MEGKGEEGERDGKKDRGDTFGSAALPNCISSSRLDDSAAISGKDEGKE